MAFNVSWNSVSLPKAFLSIGFHLFFARIGWIGSLSGLSVRMVKAWLCLCVVLHSSSNSKLAAGL